jgi:hypothetical protein
VSNLGIFQHQPQAGHAVVGKPFEVSLHLRQVATAEQAFELDPADRVVLADRRPGLAGLGDEIGRARRNLNPWQAAF